MMASISAKNMETDVVLMEKNDSPGKKLILSGNGQCNLTNTCSLDTFLSKFGKNGPFLRDAFKAFFNKDLMSFFETRGVRCEARPDNKVFPSDMRAKSVLKALEAELISRKVTCMYNSPIKCILTDKNTISGVKLKNGDIFPSTNVILASGGASYPSTGSSGDGYELARALGHTIIRPKPGLVPVIIKENYPGRLMGLSLEGVSVTVFSGKKRLSSGKGDVLFTAKGMSGPIILSMSGIVNDAAEHKDPVHMDIDLFGDKSVEGVVSLLAGLFGKYPSKSVKNALKDILPQRLAELLPEIVGVDKDKVCNQITARDRSVLSGICKRFRLTATGTGGMNEAMVTRGGVSLKEIDPKNMSSRLIPGLYFAGEVIDVAGDTGGFNLQAAFSTGYLAGKSAAGN